MSHVIEVVERIIVPDIPQVELPEEDGLPLESNWHRIEINLLVDCVRQHWRGRTDYFAGGNMFIYYSLRQARARDYKGPDFFVVKGVEGTHDRRVWIAWEEDGHLPDVIVELLSPSTATEDLGSKKNLYANRFKTVNYFCCDPEAHQLLGWQLQNEVYAPLEPNARGHLWSVQLSAWLGWWQGEYEGIHAAWLRLYDPDGNLIPTGEECGRLLAETERWRAESERRRAETERQRADAAEAQVARLRAELEKKSASE